MTDRSAEKERTPAVTVNTATDRQMGFERGQVLGYIDLAIDALSHLRNRTSAGRAWLVPDDQLDEALRWLTGLRGDVLRKEQFDGRRQQEEEQHTTAASALTPLGYPPKPYEPGRRL